MARVSGVVLRVSFHHESPYRLLKPVNVFLACGDLNWARDSGFNQRLTPRVEKKQRTNTREIATPISTLRFMPHCPPNQSRDRSCLSRDYFKREIMLVQFRIQRKKAYRVTKSKIDTGSRVSRNLISPPVFVPPSIDDV